MRLPGASSRVDEELASLARRESAVRLRLGQALELIGRGSHAELGFSSLSAYVRERCERSVRWAESARSLARRLELLPELRRRLAFGEVSWSVGEILGGAATTGTESAWLEAAQGCTVRELRALVSAARAGESSEGTDSVGGNGEGGNGEGGNTAGSVSRDAEEEMCTLTCTVNREESWLFEATRTLLDQLGARGSTDQVEALLAEAQEALLAALPRGALELPDFGEMEEAQQRWREQLARWRMEAELRCEPHFRSVGERARRGEGVSEAAREAASGLASFGAATARELDRAVRALCRALASHELELSRGLLHFHRVDGWRRLGYASETQYARERLGMSRSSMLARRGLALRLERLPAVAAALGDGSIGVEAALQLVRVATSATEVAWLERARARTAKHLREEVAAALVALRVSGEVDCWPPAERELEAFHELERAVVSGAAVSGAVVSGNTEPELVGAPAAFERGHAWWVTLQSLHRWLVGGVSRAAGHWASAEGVQVSAGHCASAEGVQVSAGHCASAEGVQVSAGAGRGHSSAGRVVLRLRMPRGTYDWWRGLERCARRWLPRRMSWLSFLCLSMWRAWRHLLGADVAYGGIYIRDRFRCTSPVCERRDVTPHHVQFRSAGGSDEASNVVAVCSECHLFGIHEDRIRASGTAEHLRWELGRREAPCVVVDGRQRVAA